jgi:integrase
MENCEAGLRWPTGADRRIARSASPEMAKESRKSRRLGTRLARAGVPELLVRDLRRTAARNMIRAGVPEKQVMLIAGWKTRSLLDRYNVVDERDVIAAGQKLDRYASELADKVRTKFVQREDKGEPVEFVN